MYSKLDQSCISWL